MSNKQLRALRINLAVRRAITLLLVVMAIISASFIWQYYVTSPWTRDGQVRVQVANVAPQISGEIAEIKIVDNQFVRKGDILYVIDKFDFQVSVASAKADVQMKAADLQVKQAQSARREALSTLSTTVEEKQTFAGTAKIAEANYALAGASLAQAQINLDRTIVRSPVNGYITNLLLRVGDYANKGTPNVSIVDADSFWIDGYFEETKMGGVHVGDYAEAVLMGYAEPVKGTVESITRGIANSNATVSTQGLPSVNPIYTWVRLAQRVPVRIKIDQVPHGVLLVAGLTATITIGHPRSASNNLVSDALVNLRRNFLPPASDVPVDSTSVHDVSTVAKLPLPELQPLVPAADAIPLLPISPDQPRFDGRR
jgi:multidrug resistance efflux pump